MMGRYKDAGEVYAYELPLMEAGFGFVRNFITGGYPEDFPEMPLTGAWAWRRAIKKWMAMHPAMWVGKECRIVRAIGYWRDLHGDFVYEIWAKTIVEMPDGLAHWMVQVLEAEGLPLCLVDVWQCRGEGEFDSIGPKIRIGLCPMGDGQYDEVATKKLFLHEVGHGVVDLAGVSFEDSYWHREAWQAEYARLEEQYLA